MLSSAAPLPTPHPPPRHTERKSTRCVRPGEAAPLAREGSARRVGLLSRWHLRESARARALAPERQKPPQTETRLSRLSASAQRRMRRARAERLRPAAGPASSARTLGGLRGLRHAPPADGTTGRRETTDCVGRDFGVRVCIVSRHHGAQAALCAAAVAASPHPVCRACRVVVRSLASLVWRWLHASPPCSVRHALMMRRRALRRRPMRQLLCAPPCRPLCAPARPPAGAPCCSRPQVCTRSSA